MLVHWVKVIWAKDGGSGTPWGPTIIFSEKKSASLNSMTLEHMYTSGSGPTKPFFLGKSYGLLKVINIDWLIGHQNPHNHLQIICKQMCLRLVCPKGGKENQTRCGGRYSYGDFGHTDHYLDPVSNMSSLILDQHLDTFVKHFVLKSIFAEICKSMGGHLATASKS